MVSVKKVFTLHLRVISAKNSFGHDKGEDLCLQPITQVGEARKSDHFLLDKCVRVICSTPSSVKSPMFNRALMPVMLYVNGKNKTGISRVAVMEANVIQNESECSLY